MFTALLALAVAVAAVVKVQGLADEVRRLASRVRRLEEDREDLRARVFALQRLTARPEAPPAGPAAGEKAPPEDAVPPSLPPSRPPSRPAPPSIAPSPAIPGGAGAPRPPSPAAPLPPATAPTSSPPIDWESLLGVKGAAWVGAIAFMIAGVFFARWSIEQGFVTPTLRFMLMLTAGLGALIAAEAGLRRGYERTASPLSGASIAVLYMALFVGHARYELFSLPLAFAGMVAVTAVAGVVSIRYDAFPTAVLGLLGGFSTPVVLSTGEDRPVALFTYILLLNLGLMAVVSRRRWTALFELGLMGTLLIELGWFSRFMSPRNLPVGLLAFLGSGLLYLALPLMAHDEEKARVARLGALGGIAPFLFAFLLAGSPAYVEQWAFLFGVVALLDLAILSVAIFRGHGSLLLSAAMATSVTVVTWAAGGLRPGTEISALAVTLFAIFLTSIFGLAGRLQARFGDSARTSLRLTEVAALTSWCGLGLYGLILAVQSRDQSSAAFLILATAMAFLLRERSRPETRLRGALSLGTLGLGSLLQIWFFRTVSGETLLLSLAVPVLLSFFVSLLMTRADGVVDREAEIGVRISCWIGILGLFLALAETTLAADGWPLFLALGVQGGLLIASVLRSDWTIGLPALLAAVAFHLLVWVLAYGTPDRSFMALGFAAAFYLFFLALPLLTPFAKWREAILPWLTAALSGPALFLPLYLVWRTAWGKSTIGLLPVMMAFVSVAGLRAVSLRFVSSPDDPLSARLRLRYLALFSAVALWFLAVAVPLQLDRQWLTLGWALEALALCWLFGRLPHRGLPGFAAILYGLVGIRLLLNPEILRYEERGLPVFNWLLYTYGVVAVCCLLGQSLLRRVSADALTRRLANGVALLGLLLGFWLVNLEILDYFSTGPYIALSDQGGYAVKLALSAGWGLYAILLLVVGVARDLRPLRYLSLAFLILTVAKVFLYDLSALAGIFRVFSFLGLAIALILVSLFYQRFVFRKTS